MTSASRPELGLPLGCTVTVAELVFDNVMLALLVDHEKDPPEVPGRSAAAMRTAAPLTLRMRQGALTWKSVGHAAGQAVVSPVQGVPPLSAAGGVGLGSSLIGVLDSSPSSRQHVSEPRDRL